MGPPGMNPSYSKLEGMWHKACRFRIGQKQDELNQNQTKPNPKDSNVVVVLVGSGFVTIPNKALHWSQQVAILKTILTQTERNSLKPELNHNQD